MFLEIGNPEKREGWETMDLKGEPTYLIDVLLGIPTPSERYEGVYMSHTLEHLPWFKTVEVLNEIRRVLVPGGWVEIHVPDGEKIVKAWLAGEHEDDWWHENPEHDKDLWLNGRIFSYGPGGNWHRTLFSESHLRKCLAKAGFRKPSRVYGSRADELHGWINLGLRAYR